MTVASNYNNSPKPYLFKLESQLGNLTLDTPPVNWKEGIIEFNREIDNGGVFKSFTIEALTFIKEGANLLKRLFDAYEANAECTLRVFYFKRSTHNYIELPSQYKGIFTSFKEVKVGDVKGVNIEFIESGDLIKFKNRKETEVDISNASETIGGAAIKKYQFYGIDQKQIELTEISNRLQAMLTTPNEERVWRTDNDRDNVTYTAIPLEVDQSDFNEVTSVTYKTKEKNIDNIGSFFQESEEARDVSITIILQHGILDDNGDKEPYSLQLVEEKEDGSTVFTKLGDSWGKTERLYSIIRSVNYSFEAKSKLKLVVKVDAVNSIDGYIITCVIAVTQGQVIEEGKVLEGFRNDDAFRYISGCILDKNPDDAYESTFIDHEVRSYDNQEALAHVMTGLNFRGGKIGNPNIPISISFEKLYSLHKVVYNIGYDFTDDGKIKIEKYADFFEDSEIDNLSDRINELDILKEYMPELAYSEIITGFKNFEYEKVNGRGEYNTNQNRTTIISTDTKYENVTEERTDTQGMVLALQNPLDQTGTTDIKGDNDIFLLKSQPLIPISQNLSNYKNETNENITVEDNTSLFGDSSLNLYFTPLRSLIRHGNRISASLTKYVSSKLKFQSSKKQATLKTTGEGYTVTENQDIQIKRNVDDESTVPQLDDPIYLPIKLIVECEFTFEDLQKLQDNKYGYYTLSSELSGYVLSVKKKLNENKASIELIQRYVSN